MGFGHGDVKLRISESEMGDGRWDGRWEANPWEKIEISI